MKKIALSLLIASLMSPAVAFAAEPDDQGPDDATQVQAVEAVDVQLAITRDKKAVGKLGGLLAWDQAADLAMDVDGQQHVTSVTVSKNGDKKFKVQLAYAVDGRSFLDTVVVDADSARKKIVRSGDGKIAIALTLAAKQVSPDQLPVPKRRPIDLPTDSTDPLAGLD